MSSRLIKNGSDLTLTDDVIIVKLNIFESGKVQLTAPNVHPKDICKILHNLMLDIQYASLQPADTTKVQPPIM